MVSVEEHRKRLLEDPDYQELQAELDREMEYEIRKSIESSRAGRGVDGDEMLDDDDLEEEDF